MLGKESVSESWEDYQLTLQSRDPVRDEWIYNILDGKTEQESIVYRDERFLLIPPLLKEKKKGAPLKKEYPTGAYLLAIPEDRSLRSIRDLRQQHLDLLKHMYTVTLEVMKSKYGVTKDQLEIEFHYIPSAYHLHIHFRKKSDKPPKTDTGLNVVHRLFDVIKLIKSDDLYFQKHDIEIMVKNASTWRANLNEAAKRPSPVTSQLKSKEESKLIETYNHSFGNYRYAVSEADMKSNLKQMIENSEVKLRIIISDSEEYTGILSGFDKQKGTVTLRRCSRFIQGSTKISVGNLFGSLSREAKDVPASADSPAGSDERVFDASKIVDIIDC